MRRFVLTLVAILAFVPAASALTVRDVIELSRAGLGEEVLIALIEVEGGVYGIDTTTLKSLKDAGVPERVIVAMVRSGRERPQPESVPAAPAETSRAPEPQVVVIDHHDAPPPREVVVPVPIYIPVDVSHRRRRHRSAVDVAPIDTTFRPFQPGVPISEYRQQPTRKAEPVYWGFGGKLRPDAWQPHPSERHDQKHDRSRPDGSKSPDRK